MTSFVRRGLPALALFATVALFSGGCGKTDPVADNKGNKGTDKGKVDDSETWWCEEHGIPEDDCALCKTSLIPEFKKKGDWCAEHERPESQCFLCNAKRAEKFAAEYRARYGKEPPPIDPKNIKGGTK